MKVLWNDKLFDSFEEFNDFSNEWEDQEADLEYFKKLLKDIEQSIVAGKKSSKKFTNRDAQDKISDVYGPLYFIHTNHSSPSKPSFSHTQL